MLDQGGKSVPIPALRNGPSDLRREALAAGDGSYWGGTPRIPSLVPIRAGGQSVSRERLVDRTVLALSPPPLWESPGASSRAFRTNINPEPARVLRKSAFPQAYFDGDAIFLPGLNCTRAEGLRECNQPSHPGFREYAAPQEGFIHRRQTLRVFGNLARGGASSRNPG